MSARSAEVAALHAKFHASIAARRAFSRSRYADSAACSAAFATNEAMVASWEFSGLDSPLARSLSHINAAPAVIVASVMALSKPAIARARAADWAAKSIA